MKIIEEPLVNIRNNDMYKISNLTYLIIFIILIGCKPERKETVDSNKDLYGNFRIQLSDTLYLGANTGKILNYKTEHDDIDYLLSVLIDNEYDNGILVKDTFSDGTLSPWFGVYANNKGKMVIKGIILEEDLNDRNSHIDSVLRIERTFFYFSKEVYVLDSIFRK